MMANKFGAPERHFLPGELVIDSWEAISPYFTDLVSRSLDSYSSLKAWLSDLSELETVIQEHVGWLYIRMTCDTKNEKLTEAYTYFVNEINPHIEPLSDALNKKLDACQFASQLGKEYSIYLREVKNAIQLYRDENVPLNAELTVKEQKYGEIAGAMSVQVEGRELTLQQASNYLRVPDRNMRESVYRKITERRWQDHDTLNELFTSLIQLRDRIALNAGFDNYRDYKFRSLNRFDYSVKDCELFHHAVHSAVVPLLDQLMLARKQEMGLDGLRPWDLEVDTQGLPDLKPFSNGNELAEKTISCFTEIDPYFGEVIRTLHDRKFMDLDSRIGKAPGGYNYPLYETGIPYIFMNSSGSLRDVVTMVHEGGHAIHSMLTHELPFIGFKEFPSEIAELASMSMELISMEHWHHFFSDKEELRRARREQLENVIEGLPWIACVDRYQHWLYLNPGHSVEERESFWEDNFSRFSSKVTDWKGLEHVRRSLWQKQLHLYEVPFYYIEYGMAQLGAIAMWKSYREHPTKAIENYKKALRMGHTASIPEIYRAAGIAFDFSESHIRDLMVFVKTEYDKL